MLQRIQSVYLALVICCCIFLCFFNLFVFQVPDGIYQLSIIKTSFISDAKISVLSYNFPLLLINILIAILTLVTIFNYANRALQLKFINLMITLVLILIGVLFYNYRQLVSLSGTSNISSIKWIIIFMPIQLIFLFLARNGIKKDDNLVRSADRLR